MPNPRLVPHEPFDSYRERFSEHFVLTRSDGVLEARFHTQGKATVWSMELHQAIPQLFVTIGADPENEVVILTGTGEHWILGYDTESWSAVEGDPETWRASNYDHWYLDGTRMQEALLWNIDVPVIAAINGPGIHTEFGLMCDLTIASEEARFWDRHFRIGLVPGDGQFLVFQELLGIKRANYEMYVNSDGIAADRALELGLVNEVMPRGELLPRARELAAKLMEQDRIVRRLTTSVARRRWRRLLTDDLQAHFASEMYAVNVSRVIHTPELAVRSL